ncbi:MAG: hypothetical protein Ta2B_06660 [Termitinemataceae bacterium]|nr:MAG: hypothetical protein Ta2B_06660 [Termitinemataceae bacterium]
MGTSKTSGCNKRDSCKTYIFQLLSCPGSVYADKTQAFAKYNGKFNASSVMTKKIKAIFRPQNEKIEDSNFSMCPKVC